jgi:hypothetical protein
VLKDHNEIFNRFGVNAALRIFVFGMFDCFVAGEIPALSSEIL